MIEQVMDPGLIGAAYDELLVPAFRPSELVSRDEIIDAVRTGDDDVLTVRRDGALVAVAVGERYEGSTLLAYLAVSAAGRSGGIGGALLEGATARWMAEPGTTLVIAEIERPDLHPPHPEHGDPARRLAFYARHGARALDLPYFQPALRDDLPREYGLLLIVLAAVPRSLSADGQGLDDVTALRRFLDATVGAPGQSDSASLALYASTVPGVRLLPLDQYEQIPVSPG